MNGLLDWVAARRSSTWSEMSTLWDVRWALGSERENVPWRGEGVDGRGSDEGDVLVVVVAGVAGVAEGEEEASAGAGGHV